MRGEFQVGHEAALRDQLFTAMPQTPDAGDTFRSDFDFDERVPVLVFAKNSATATRRSVLRSLTLEQVGSPDSDANLKVMVAIDPAYRYSSGGAQVTPVSMRSGWDSSVSGNPTAEMEVRYGSPGGAGTGHTPEIIATAASANTRYVQPVGIQAGAGGLTVIDFGGELWVDTVGSILVYVWTEGTLAQEFNWKADLYEYRRPT